MTDNATTDAARALARTIDWRWELALGIVLVIGGLVALGNPFLASLAVEVIAAIVFAAAGLLQFWLAWKSEHADTGARIVGIALGVLLILFALSLMISPLAGLVSLTLLMAGFFLAAGLIRLWLASKWRHRDGWGWLAASGCVSVLLGLLIFFALPEAATGILGLFLGIELVVSGAAAIALALRTRAAA